MDKKELLAKLDACKTEQDLQKFISENGIELGDEELDAVNGGASLLSALLNKTTSSGEVKPIDQDTIDLLKNRIISC